jgi:hypothetical protein
MAPREVLLPTAGGMDQGTDAFDYNTAGGSAGGETAG